MAAESSVIHIMIPRGLPRGDFTSTRSGSLEAIVWIRKRKQCLFDRAYLWVRHLIPRRTPGLLSAPYYTEERQRTPGLGLVLHNPYS